MLLSWLKLWFTFQLPVDRRTYLRHGLGLAALKYAVDAALVWAVAQRVWTPFDYFNPLWKSRASALSPAPEWLLFALALWAAPFALVGVSLSLRRALDARVSPWIALLFFLPGVNWVLLAVMALLPSRPAPAGEVVGPARSALEPDQIRAAFQGVGGGLVVGAVLAALWVLALHRYGGALFLGTPFSMCAAGGFFFNRRLARSPRATAAVGTLSVLLLGGGMLLFAFEGGLCLVMALPLAIPLGMAGALFGRFIALETTHTLLPGAALVLLLALPAGAVAESALGEAPLREVVSAVEVDAPPDKVWPNVIGFAELPPPKEWIFQTGIAFPVRARIAGEGVGAIRKCEFSTGPFVEPITAWEPPNRLAFSVTAQPPPMQEWSPYRHLHPPHLDGTLRSRRGEFRLLALSGGRTRLEGRTWYSVEMGPSVYWALWSDALIHRIHVRVLEHVKALSEARTAADRGPG